MTSTPICPECGTAQTHRPGGRRCRVAGLRAALKRRGFAPRRHVPEPCFELCRALKMTRREMTALDARGNPYAEEWIPLWAWRTWNRLPGGARRADDPGWIAFARRILDRAKGSPELQSAIYAALKAGADIEFIETLTGR